MKWKGPNDGIVRSPPRYLNIGNTRVELFPVEYGNSVFRPSVLDVGDYIVDGVSFSVFEEPNPTGIQSSSSTNSRTSSNGSNGSPKFTPRKFHDSD